MATQHVWRKYSRWVGIVLLSTFSLVGGREHQLNASIGILMPVVPVNDYSFIRYVAAAMMAVRHVNNAVPSLVPAAAKLLPTNLHLDFDLQNSKFSPSVGVARTLQWQQEGINAIVGPATSPVAAQVALAATTDSTPVVSWGATSSKLSEQETYPTLFRVVPSDRLLAAGVYKSIKALGWFRVGILYEDGEWGSAFAQEGSYLAVELGIEIGAHVAVQEDDDTSFAKAAAALQQSGVRVVVCTIHAPDVHRLAWAADTAGLLGSGYVWILTMSSMSGFLRDPGDVATARRLRGWMMIEASAMHDKLSERFNEVFRAEPLSHLNHSLIAPWLEDAVGGQCSQYCGLVYDSVWTTALALSQVKRDVGGRVDKDDLKRQIHNVSFEGATGLVSLHKVTGDRTADGVPILLKSLESVEGPDGTVTLDAGLVWQWVEGAGLIRMREDPPVWPGGERGWLLPVSGLACEGNQFFSPTALQCVPCPRGTNKQEGRCVPYNASIGILVPLRSGSRQLGNYFVNFGAIALMALQHVNQRSSSLVTDARALLPEGFRLSWELHDSRVSATTAVSSVLGWQREEKHVVVGPLTSSMAGPVAQIAAIDDTPVLSYGASSDTLSNKVHYPMLSRTAVADSVLAHSAMRCLTELRLLRIAILMTDTQWSMAVAQEAANAAATLGIEVAAQVQFPRGDAKIASIAEAVSGIKALGIRVVLCAVWGDIPHIAMAASRQGMLTSGYAWVVLDVSLDAFVREIVEADYPDDPKLSEVLSGWINVRLDILTGARAERFRHVLQSEPLEHLNHSVMEGFPVQDAIASGSWDMYGAQLYDAVFAAAIAISRSNVGADGTVDKSELIYQLRNTAFDGASGRVEFESGTGDRVGEAIPVLLLNWQPAPSDDEHLQLAEVPVWQLVRGEGLLRLSSQPPLWPGGERAWQIPQNPLDCEEGEVYSDTSLQCEPCPPGTDVENGICKRFHASLGMLVRLHDVDGSALSVWSWRVAAAATMAVQHVNARSSQLVPDAASLLPAGFRLVFDLQNTKSQASHGVSSALEWNSEGRHCIVGAERSAVSGSVSLAASIASTPVISFASTAVTLSDKRLYPTFSRVAVSDDAMVEATIGWIAGMGWTRIGIVFVEDTWGRGYGQGASVQASSMGIRVAASEAYTDGDDASIERAIAAIKQSRVRVVLCAAFPEHIPAIVEAADRHGMLETGFAWIQPEFSAASVASLVSNPHNLVGWMSITLDTFRDSAQAFNDVMRAEPLQNMNHSLLAPYLSRSLIDSAPCSQECGKIYDAVFTAAIAIAETGTAQDGTVDKARLLQNIRKTDFVGATGRVRFDPVTGDRVPDGIPARVSSVKRVSGQQDPTRLESMVAWEWSSGAGVLQVSAEAPSWPGGRQSWHLPQETVACPAQRVYSSSSQQCEPCPAGTSKFGTSCERFQANIAVLVPLRASSGEPLDDAYRLLAEAALMAVSHINNRVTTLVPDAASLLPGGFRLAFDMQDSHLESAVGVANLVKWNEQKRNAIVGSLRSSVTATLSQVATLSHLPVVSYGATAPIFSDKTAHPTFSRLVPSDEGLVTGAFEAMAAMKWKSVGLMLTNDEWGRGISQTATTTALTLGMQVALIKQIQVDGQHPDSIKEEARLAVASIKASGVRVILVALTAHVQQELVVEAQRAGLLTAGYIWCSFHNHHWSEHMVGWVDFSLVSESSSGARFYRALETEPAQHLLHPLLNASHTGRQEGSVNARHDTPMVYDALWATAIAIGRAGLDEDGSVDPDAMIRHLRNLSFLGASGRVTFNHQTGDRALAAFQLVIRNVRRSARRAGSETLEAAETWRYSESAGLEAVSGVSPPIWVGGEESWDPPADIAACAEGHVLSLSSRRCEPCPPGTRWQRAASWQAGGASSMVDSCQPCPLGSFAPEAASLQCVQCFEGYANATGMDKCVGCPPNTRREPLSPGRNVSECVCAPGYYHRGGFSWECQLCPPGADCKGGAAPPVPLAGFWGDRECTQFGGNKSCSRWDLFVECNPEKVCEGSAAFRCAEGRAGALCMESDQGWFKVGQDHWAKCGPGSEIVTVASIGGVLLCWIGIEVMVEQSYPAFGTALLFVQVSTIIAGYGLRWHPYVQTATTVLSIADFDVDFIEPSCFGPWSQASSFYLQLLLPFLFAFFSALCFAVWRVVHRKALKVEEIIARAGRQFVVITIATYHTLCLRCFQIFSCSIFPDGLEHVRSLPQVVCWHGQHITMTVISALYIAVVVVGVPCFIFWVLRRHIRAGTLHHAEAVARWRFLHCSYESQWKYWELAMLLRRLLVALLSVVDSPMIAGALTNIVLAFLLAAHVFARPFINPNIDMLDFFSICGSILFCLSGMLFYSNVTAAAQGKVCMDAVSGCEAELRMKEIVAIIAITLLIGTILVSLWLAWAVLRETMVAHKARHIIFSGLDAEKAALKSLRALSESANMASLETVLDGSRLTHAAQLLSTKRGLAASVDKQAFARHYLVVDRGIREITEDVTQYCSLPRARTLRALCTIPGLLEILAWEGDDVRASVGQLFDALVRQTEASPSDADGSRLALSRCIKFEHQPVVALWLLSCSANDRQSFLGVIDGILAANRIASHSKTLHPSASLCGRRHVMAEIAVDSFVSRRTESQQTTSEVFKLHVPSFEPTGNSSPHLQRTSTSITVTDGPSPASLRASSTMQRAASASDEGDVIDDRPAAAVSNGEAASSRSTQDCNFKGVLVHPAFCKETIAIPGGGAVSAQLVFVPLSQCDRSRCYQGAPCRWGTTLWGGENDDQTINVDLDPPQDLSTGAGVDDDAAFAGVWGGDTRVSS